MVVGLARRCHQCAARVERHRDTYQSKNKEPICGCGYRRQEAVKLELVGAFAPSRGFKGQDQWPMQARAQTQPESPCHATNSGSSTPSGSAIPKSTVRASSSTRIT